MPRSPPSSFARGRPAARLGRLVLGRVRSAVVDVVAAIEAAGGVEDRLVAVHVGDLVEADGVVGAERLIAPERVDEADPVVVMALAVRPEVPDLARPRARTRVDLQVRAAVADRRGDSGPLDGLALALQG